MSGIDRATRDRARLLRAGMTPLERRLWAKLRELNRMLGLHVRRQAPIGPVIAEFADLGRRIVIEIDGEERDAGRQAWLEGQGFRVLRFPGSEVAANLDDVMIRVLDAVEASPLRPSPPPPPSPTRGEGGAQRAMLRGTQGTSASPPPCGEGMGVGDARAKGGGS